MTPAPPLRPARLSRLLGLALLWGSNFLWIKIALRGFDPVQVVFVRLTLGALVLASVVVVRRERMPRDLAAWRHLAVAALLACVLPYLLFAIAEQHVDSSIAGLLNATTPLWTAVTALAVGLESRGGPLRIAGIAIGFVGALVIFEPWHHGSQVMSLGGLACLLAAACYGISFVYMARNLRRDDLSPLALSAGQLALSAVFSAAALPVLGRHAPHFRVDAALAALTLGALGTGLAYLLNYRLICESGASGTAVVTYLLPIVAVVLGAVVLGETLTLTEGIGAAVVLAGVALTRLKARPGSVA